MSKKGKARLPQTNNEDEDLNNKNKKEQQQNQFSLYALLQTDNKATKEEIKKQYRKLVLQYHPDKNKQDPQARQKFQKLKEAYDILIDDQKRKQYDETGMVGDDFNQNAFQSAYDYFRKIYRKITKEDIDHFETQYREGPMELQDLLNFYQEHQGDMTGLLQCIPLSRNEDIPRLVAILEQKINEKEIPLYKNFNKTKKKVRLLPNEQKQAQQQKNKGLSELAMAIHSRAAGRVDFIASLQQKYGVGKKQKKEKQQKKQEQWPKQEKANKKNQYKKK